MPKTIAILLFPEVEELDFVGPWEVFGYLATVRPGSCRVFTVAEQAGEVRCAKGLRVLAEHGFAGCPPADVLVVPGGRGTRTEVDNPRLIDFVRRVGDAAEVAASVCTGAFLLARAGLLAGRQATTHWRSLDRLRALEGVRVVEARWVDEGRVVTAAGVSAGIDAALHLVGRFWGAETARLVQQGIEYFPAPPYADLPLPPP
jgi:transcriptional regulator GlxA family with amidase domain